MYTEGENFYVLWNIEGIRIGFHGDKLNSCCVRTVEAGDVIKTRRLPMNSDGKRMLLNIS